MSRCKGCDAVLGEREIIWDADRKEHEELCSVCRTLVLDTLVEMDTLSELMTDEDQKDDETTKT